MQLTMLLPGCAHCEWEEVTGRGCGGVLFAAVADGVES